VLFLGAADGTSVFYDASAHAAVKIPTNSVVVSVEDSASPFDPACDLKPVPSVFGLRVFHFERKLAC
jgi:hypothetical protein